jgi:predicted N-acetyltransferase YhbS
VKLRFATSKDVVELAALGTQFVAQEAYRPFIIASRGRLLDYMARVVAHGAVIVATDDSAIVGMIGLGCAEHPMSGEKMAAEAFWYVLPGHRNGVGRELMQAGEAWARAQGAVRLQMSAPNDRIGAVYRRAGFAALETTYQKDLR